MPFLLMNELCCQVEVDDDSSEVKEGEDGSVEVLLLVLHASYFSFADIVCYITWACKQSSVILSLTLCFAIAEKEDDEESN